MTEQELAQGTARLKELQKSATLHQDALKKLSAWWKEKVRQDENKVVSLDEYRRWRQ